MGFRPTTPAIVRASRPWRKSTGWRRRLSAATLAALSEGDTRGPVLHPGNRGVGSSVAAGDHAVPALAEVPTRAAPWSGTTGALGKSSGRLSICPARRRGARCQRTRIALASTARADSAEFPGRRTPCITRILQAETMPAPQEPSAAATLDTTHVALLNATDVRWSRRAGRTLSFHGASWRALSGADLTGLLQAPPHRPHIRVEDIATLLGGNDDQGWPA